MTQSCNLEQKKPSPHLKLIFLMSITRQLSLTQWLHQKRNNCDLEGKESVLLMCAKDGLFCLSERLCLIWNSPLIWYHQELACILNRCCDTAPWRRMNFVCVCARVSVQARGCSPGSGYYKRKSPWKCIQSYVLSIDSHTNCNIPQKSSSAPANTHWPSLLMLTSFNL